MQGLTLPLLVALQIASARRVREDLLTREMS
jgi:hypothetical protein